jgi:hypothetical protein
MQVCTTTSREGALAGQPPLLWDKEASPVRVRAGQHVHVRLLPLATWAVILERRQVDQRPGVAMIGAAHDGYVLCACTPQPRKVVKSRFRSLSPAMPRGLGILKAGKQSMGRQQRMPGAAHSTILSARSLASEPEQTK